MNIASLLHTVKWIRWVVVNVLPPYALFFTLPLFVELPVARFLQKRSFPLREVPVTIFICICQVFITCLGNFYIKPLHRFVRAHALFAPEKNLLYWVGVAIACEFIFFSGHWAAHNVRWIWNEHQVHHSSEDMNWFVGHRNGWTALVAGTWFFLLPFTSLGFRFRDLDFGLTIILTYQLFVHTNVIRKLGPLEYLLHTPSRHRVHHSTQGDHLDKNFGGMTLLFDYLFGTLEREEPGANLTFGLRGQPGPRPALQIVFGGWFSMFHDFVKAPTVRLKWLALTKVNRG